jgi:hypothetical protein
VGDAGFKLLLSRRGLIDDWCGGCGDEKTLDEGTHFEDPCRRKINLYLQGVITGEYWQGLI